MHFVPNKASISPICENSLHIWTLHLPKQEKNLSEYDYVLSLEERKKSARFKTRDNQISYVLARGGLRFILQKYLDIPANEINFSVNLYGKPKIESTPGPALEFNLSHSGDYVIYAITKNTPVGVDIEKIRRRTSEQLKQLACRFFSKNEANLIVNTPQAEMTQLFFSLWTKKEAYTKQHGLGLRLPLSSFTVSISSRPKASLVNPSVNLFSLPSSHTYDLPAPIGYCAAYSIAVDKKMKVEYFIKT